MAKAIKNKYKNIEFLIAGWNEEEEYKKIVAEYQEQGIVNYIGFRSDIHRWIKKCNCTVLPSHGGEKVFRMCCLRVQQVVVYVLAPN